MSTTIQYPHLIVDQNGKLTIENTRYSVLHLAAEHYQHGWTAEELLRQHPDLNPEEVYAALTYFYDHREAMIREMKSSYNRVEAMRSDQSISREELLKRQTIKAD